MSLIVCRMCHLADGHTVNCPAGMDPAAQVRVMAQAQKTPVMEDSGKRREFRTGAVRDVTEGKGWYAGISPIAMKRLALVLQKGAAKYAPRNWEKGIPLSSFFDSSMRHLFQWANGEVDEDHLAQALWNVMALLHTADKVAAGDLPQELRDMGPNEDRRTVPLTAEQHYDTLEKHLVKMGLKEKSPI